MREIADYSIVRGVGAKFGSILLFIIIFFPLSLSCYLFILGPLRTLRLNLFIITTCQVYEALLLVVSP